jgi:hypothetical protein
MMKLEYLDVNPGEQTLALSRSPTATGGGAAIFAFGDRVHNIVRGGVNLRC